jgi:hypothetical protein
MTDDGLADLKAQGMYLLNDYSAISYWKGDYPSWTRMGFATKIIKILY